MQKLLKISTIVKIKLFILLSILIFSSFLKQYRITNSEYNILEFVISFMLYYFILKPDIKETYKIIENLFKKSRLLFFKYSLIYILSFLFIVLTITGIAYLFINFYPEIIKEIEKINYKNIPSFLKSGKDFLLFYFVAMFFAPILEEFIFRRILFFNLRENLSFKYASIISSFLFGLIHSTGDVLSATILGFYLAYIFEKEKNIVLNILIHSFINLNYIILMYYYKIINF